MSLLGVTFKANTDDMRDSPSIEIVDALQKSGAKLKIYDPSFSDQAKAIFKNIEFSGDPYECCTGAEAVVILTDWTEFKGLNFKALSQKVKQRLLIDLRNMYNVSEVESEGFKYYSVGRKIKGE